MKKHFRKGFTIVELVTVIAIIGVLVAVLVPVFVNITSKANIVSDQSLVRTLNNALAMKEYEIDDKTNKNPSDMVEDLRFEGYDLETLLKRHKSDKNIIYNLPKNRFLFSDDIGSSDFAGSKSQDFWEFKNTASFASEGYSLYLFEDYEGGDITNLSTGLDTGKNDEEFDISYETDSDKEVIIKTNGGTLTIDARNGTVNHYGNAEVLVVNAINDHSYHEFGTINKGQIKTGHIVIENKDASINSLLLIAKSETEGFDKIKIAAKSGATLPTLDRTNVVIGANGTKVCDISIDNDTNAIWLYSNGIYENIKIADEEATSVHAGSDGAPAKSTPLGKASFEIANAALRNEEDELVDTEGNPVSTTDAVISEKDTPTVEEIEAGTTNFSGGLGTEANPYLISRVSQFANITGEFINKNYMLTKDFDIKIEDFGNKRYLIEELTGSLDGGNFRFKLPHSTATNYPSLVNNLNGTLKNMDFEIDNLGVIALNSTQGATFDNVDVYGNINISGDNYGAYLYENNSLEVNFVGCNFYGSISAGGTKSDNTAIYVRFNVKPSNPDSETVRLSFDNCHNYGTVTSGDAAMFVGNTTQINYIGTRAYLLLDVNNCTNEGVIEWVDSSFYRPYNHFVASNVQEVKEIDLNGIRYIKTVNMSEAQKEEAGINGTTIKEMEQINSQHPTSLWGSTRLYKHDAPTMLDANGRNYVASIPDSSLALYLLDDGSFRLYKASSNVAYYEITDKTYVHYNGASQVYTIVERINANQLVNGKYTTAIKNYSFVDDRWINNENHPERLEGEFGVITLNGVDYKTYTINNETKYFYDDEGSGFYFAGDEYRNHPGSVYVSAYDDNGKIICSAKLSDLPEPSEDLPSWYVAYNADSMTNLVELGKSSTNVSESFNPSNPSALVQGKYVSTTEGSGPYYEGGGGTYDYLSGCIKIDNITNDTCIFIKTKSTFSNSHDRLFIGYAGAATRIYHYGAKAVTLSACSNYYDEYFDGEYHIYRINLNDYYLGKIKKDKNDPNTLAASTSDVYIRLSVYGEGCGDTIIYIP